MPRINHFDQSYDDPEAAAKFYEQVFGWKSEIWNGGDQPYWMITTGPESEAGINGGFMTKTSDSQPGVINTLTVDDLDTTVSRVEAAGGQIAMPKMTIPGVGYQIYCIDSGGVMFGLHQTDESA